MFPQQLWYIHSHPASVPGSGLQSHLSKLGVWQAQGAKGAVLAVETPVC